MFPVDSGGRDL